MWALRLAALARRRNASGALALAVAILGLAYRQWRRARYAYVINLWGSSRAYAIGALVLGHSIQATKTPHSLVCLYTDDVPEAFITLLSKVWDCRLVEHVQSSQVLHWADQDVRFEHVFTKLRAMSLVEFEKVLVMDIDLLVMGNVDHLFKLQPPAAMHRGVQDVGWTYKHGECLDGRRFFAGSNPGKNTSWGQGTGINAGVMLWRPSVEVLESMLEEIIEPNHPSHIRGNGPEQDYLSRYWSDAPWTQIAVEYNYQLHHMFNSLHPWCVQNCDRVHLAADPSQIKIVHFSGESGAKPWHRVLDSKLAHLWPDRGQDKAHLDLVLGEFRGYWLWIARDKSAWQKLDQFKVRPHQYDRITRSEDGTILYENDDGVHTAVEMPESAATAVVNTLRHCMSAWYDAFTAVERRVGVDVVKLLSEAVSPEVQLLEVEPGPSWKSSWFAKPFEHVPTPMQAKVSKRDASGPPRVQWQKRGGWMHERQAGILPAARRAVKVSVACSAQPGASFVVFSWGGKTQAYFQEGSESMQGVYVQTSGREPRQLAVQAGDLAPLRFWLSSVSGGQMVLLAIIGLEQELLQEVLLALEPLGVPQGPLQATDGLALAAAGCAVAGPPWDAAHASADVAYSSAYDIIECEPAGESSPTDAA